MPILMVIGRYKSVKQVSGELTYIKLVKFGQKSERALIHQDCS